MKTIDLFLTVLRAVEAKVKATVLADSVGGEGLLAVYKGAPQGLTRQRTEGQRLI